jgi:hypothetical protein
MTTGSISGGTNQGNTVAKDYAGGIVGYMKAGSITGSTNKNTGSIGGSNTIYAGGIVGYMLNGTISSTRNLANVEAITNAGGIIGTMTSGTIEGCENRARVTAICCGGMVGKIPNANSGVQISNSDNYVAGSITSKADANNNGWAGGVVGSMTSGTIKDCGNGADITAHSDAGGIVGSMANGLIKDSRNSNGSVRAIQSNKTGNIYAGGIVGYLSGGAISNCTNSRLVSAGQENGKKDLTPYAGGIAGYSNGTIKDCTNSGTIKAYGYKKPTILYYGYRETIWGDESIKAISAEVSTAVFDTSEVSVTFEAKTKDVYSAKVYAGKIVGFLDSGGAIQGEDPSGGLAYKYDYKIKFGRAHGFSASWDNFYNPGWYTEDTFKGNWSFDGIEDGEFKFKKSILRASFEFSFTTNTQGVSCGNVGNL